MLTENGLTPLQNAALATPTTELAHQLIGTYIAGKSTMTPPPSKVELQRQRAAVTGLICYAGTTPMNRGWWRTLWAWLGLR